MNHLRNLREVTTVSVAVSVPVTVLMGMLVIVRVAVFVRMIMRMAVVMVAFTTTREMHIKFHPINRTFLPAIGTERVTLQSQLF